jgi:hypothetical protein
MRRFVIPNLDTDTNMPGTIAAEESKLAEPANKSCFS